MDTPYTVVLPCVAWVCLLSLTFRVLVEPQIWIRKAIPRFFYVLFVLPGIGKQFIKNLKGVVFMKQFKILMLASFIASFIIGCSSSSEPDINNPNTIPEPEGFYKFDIKTHFVEKASIKGAKAGLKGLLEECQWGKVKEFGEDYSVWIGDIIKTAKSGNRFDVEFTLYLCPPSAFNQGESIKEETFSITYDLDDFEYDDEGNIKEDAMKDIVLSLGNTVAAASGIPFASSAISLLSSFISGEESSIKNKQQKAESIIIGGMCFGQVKLWMNEIEASN